MTENTPETPQDGTQVPQVPQAPQDPQDGTQGTQNDDTDQDHPAAEAKKYRLRLREAEAERDNLAARLEAMQKAEIERLAGHLTKPSAIWAAGVKVQDVLDDEGNIDPDKVAPAITAAAEALGLAHRHRPPRPHPAQHGPEAEVTPRRDGMAAVIAGRQ